jgi:hypothetical protein
MDYCSYGNDTHTHTHTHKYRTNLGHREGGKDTVVGRSEDSWQSRTHIHMHFALATGKTTGKGIARVDAGTKEG